MARLRLLAAEQRWPFIFWCAFEDCRGRATAPSLRLLGRKLYLGAIVVLISIMCQGMSERRMRQLTGMIEIDSRTIARWREWWRDTFTKTSFWQMARAAFMPPVDEQSLPAALLDRFAGTSVAERLIALLRLLSPLSAGGGVQAR